MKQTIIFEGDSCENLDAEDATTLNAVIPAIPTAIHLAENTPTLIDGDPNCSGGQFKHSDMIEFDEESCPVCEGVCVNDIKYTPLPLTDMNKELRQQFHEIYATLKKPVESECFLKLTMEGTNNGFIYLKVPSGSSTTDTETIVLDAGEYTIKGNVKEE